MRKFTLLTLSLMVGLCSQAKDITQSQAMQIARNFIAHSAGATQGPDKAPANLRLAYTGNATNGKNCLYVFSRGTTNGYVVVAADDQADAILGYSDSGTFDATLMPDNMRAWLDAYVDQISYIKQHGIKKAKAASKTYDNAVAPLLGNIQWNQDSPYNDQCPIYDMSSRCATGCVATAMAQVMYYNRWPEQGIGSHTYAPSILSGKTITADFGNTRYAWDAMLPQYDASSSDESRAAVAELMLHCGVAVDMVYSSSSGAGSQPIAPALVNYFGYDRGVAYRTRQNYSSEEWQRIIIDELDHKRPMIALGVASSGGHCFVFDGYDHDGLVHVNWGWGGMSNGYFRTSALNPASQGIGGADGGFNSNQYLITGIQRPQAGTYADVEIVTSEGLVPSRTTVATSDKFSVALHGTMYNAGWQDANVYFGMYLADADGNIVKTYSNATPDDMLMGYIYTLPDFEDVTIGDVADGNYRLYPAARSTDEGAEWQPLRDQYVGYPSYLNVSVKDGNATFSYPDYFCLNADNVQTDLAVYSGKLMKTAAHIKNDGDVCYFGEVQVTLVDPKTGRDVKSGTALKVDLAPGDDMDIKFVDAFSVEPGDYLLTITDDDGRHICNSKPITLGDAPSVAEVTPAKQLAFEGVVSKENLDITAHIKCTKGFYSGYAYFFILNESGAVQKGCLDQQFFSVSEGDVADVRFTGPFENGVDGTTYTATILLYDGTSYAYLNPRSMATCQFTLGQATGISSVSAAQFATAEIYTIDGKRIQATDINSLPHGTYVVKTEGKSFKFCK